MNQQIAHIALVVDDYDEAIKFYTEKLNFILIEDTFLYYKGKRFCYLWIHKKYRKSYIGIVDGNKIEYSGLLSENRARMKILLPDPDKNMPLKKINDLLKKVLVLYR